MVLRCLGRTRWQAAIGQRVQMIQRAGSVAGSGDALDHLDDCLANMAMCEGAPVHPVRRSQFERLHRDARRVQDGHPRLY
eukprot:7637683-Pyramimonas_sp.AAC.1